MNPGYLREEAARFRGMAGTADLEASKVRWLALAIDFDSRATAGDELIAPKQDDEFIEPKLDEGIRVKTSRKIAMRGSPSTAIPG